MVQILQRSPKGPSMGQQLLGGAIQGGTNLLNQFNARRQQLNMEKEQQQASQQRAQQLQQLTGMDLSGLPPEMQQAAFVETLKSQGKEKLMGQKQSFLESLFGGGKQSMQQDQMPEELPFGADGQQEQGFDPSQIPDAAIAQATAMDPALGRELRAAKDSAQKERLAERTFQERQGLQTRKEEAALTKPLLLELNQVRKNIPLQEQSIEDIVNAAPEVNALDYIADVTGFEPLRSASGAKMKTAIKDFFLSDLTRAGARPNMWVEQQLADALPKIGRSKEANLVVAEGMKFKVDLAKKRLELIDELSDRDRQKYGYVRSDIDSRAYKMMKPFVEERKKEMKESIKGIKSKGAPQEQQFIRMKSPDGEVWEIPAGDVDEAEENGFIFG